MAVTVLIATFWLLASPNNLHQSGRLLAVLPIAKWKLGSWVAAISLLFGALAVLGKHA